MAANPILTLESKPILERKTTIEEKIAELRLKRTLIQQGGGKKRIDKHHADGKLTARERVENLVDRGSFQEVGAFRKTSFHLLRHGGQGPAGGWSDHGLRDSRWPPGSSCQPGFHCRRRRCRRSSLRQDYRNDAGFVEDRESLRVHQ